MHRLTHQPSPRTFSLRLNKAPNNNKKKTTGKQHGTISLVPQRSTNPGDRITITRERNFSTRQMHLPRARAPYSTIILKSPREAALLFHCDARGAKRDAKGKESRLSSGKAEIRGAMSMPSPFFSLHTSYASYNVHTNAHARAGVKAIFSPRLRARARLMLYSRAALN